MPGGIRRYPHVPDRSGIPARYGKAAQNSTILECNIPIWLFIIIGMKMTISTYDYSPHPAL